MLIVRYSAQFSPLPGDGKVRELLVSLATIEFYVLPYVDLTIVLYCRSDDEAAYSRLLNAFQFNWRLHKLEDGTQAVSDLAFAQSLVHCEAVDRLCVLRMINDFRVLDPKAHRLLLGTDVFFLGVPDELLKFSWTDHPVLKVLYMVDTSTFRGDPYRLRYYTGEILEGLLGDFYCLAPGVGLRQDAIRGCLRMVDEWPAEPSRYVPAVDFRSTQCEQQAAAILLHQFGGEALKPSRYGHIAIGPGSVVVHTHDLGAVLARLPQVVVQRCQQILETLTTADG